ncbi:MAG: site-2 protease family protein [Defluviitaleaceae bacterium]|nr:site-2 protease family protein [Defluviitaleaceae bacterium]MCL2835597.1 site-2 protease family protein [Defluviitaleaceae bacterium]
MNIVIAILVFSVIIIIHELGHFWAARSCGILVEEFAIGMGPKIFGVKRGDTVFSLRMFPIGGSCRMLGDEAEPIKSKNTPESFEDEELKPGKTLSADGRSFPSKPVWKRLIVIAAGSVMNAVLAFCMMFAIFSTNGFLDTTVGSVVEGFPAQAAGILPGDRISRVNGRKMLVRSDISEAIAAAVRNNPGQATEIEIIRDGRKHIFNLTPQFNPAEDQYMIGFSYEPKLGLFSRMPGGIDIARASFGDTVRTSANMCVFLVRSTYQVIGMLMTRQASIGELMGPIGIVSVIGEAFEQSISISLSAALTDMMWLVSLLSVNLAVLNLLPLPMLDGGRIIFLLIEGVRRKPINPEKEGIIHFAGFVLLMILAVFVAYNDILKLI